MKYSFLALAFVVAVSAWAQPKPNVGKAETALKAGKLDEAKAIIDVTTAAQDYMLNKKGEPSKNAAKAWYIKAMTYLALDTTKNSKYSSLASNPFDTAKEALTKFDELDKGKSKSMMTDFTGLIEVPIADQRAYIANALINRSVQTYQTKEDDAEKKKALYKKSFYDIEKVVFLLPKDTSMLMNAGVYMGPQAEEYQKSLEYIKRYIALGGKNADAYVQMFSIYRDKLKDNDKALEVVQEMIKKYPERSEFPRYLLDLYVKSNRLPEAKALMEKEAAANPKDKEARYFAGLICDELKDKPSALKWYREAVALDPDYYEPNASLAQEKYNEVRDLREKRNAIPGKNDVENKKRQELYQQIRAKLEEALPLYQKLESLKPNEENVLYGLYTIYTDLSKYDEAVYSPKIKALKAKMKGLGMEID